MRILAVDPGDKNIGLAISDPTGTIANPLGVLHHIRRETDAQRIFQIAIENQIECIIIGLATDDEGAPSYQGRKAVRLMEMLKTITVIPVVLWDESGSTNIAKQAHIEMGRSRQKRKGHLDSIAATIILQTYLDSIER